MAEYIEREAVAMGILGLTIVDPMVAQYADTVLLQIQKVPAADAAPVVHGRWIEHEFEDEPCFGTEYECSACGKFQYGESKYCPNCGANMQGGENE